MSNEYNEYNENVDTSRILQSNYIKSCSDCDGCDDCDSCGGDCELHDSQNRASNIRSVIMVSGVKGGIGKTSVCGILANNLVKRGYNVGILDANLSASAVSTIYNRTEKPTIREAGIIPLISENGVKLMSLPCFLTNEAIPMTFDANDAKEFALQFYSDVVWGTLDVLLIDCPSDTADVMQELINIKELNGIVLVTDAGELSKKMAQKTINFAWINKLNVLGLVENFANFYEDKTVIDELCESYSISARDSLDFDMTIRNLADSGRFSEYDKEVLAAVTDKLIYVSEHVNDKVYEAELTE